MRNSGFDEAQAGIKFARKNINNLIYADDTTLMAESEEGLKSLLMKVKEVYLFNTLITLDDTKALSDQIISNLHFRLKMHSMVLPS